VDLKAQSKHRDKNCPVRMNTKLFEFKKRLNMEPKTDKERSSRDDITFLSEIITNSRYWQEFYVKISSDNRQPDVGHSYN
jgi:hypothetical protein